MRVVSLALVLCVAAEKASPVDRVVELIQGLKAKIIADGKKEQATYDKYACWCEKTTGRKTGDIAAAQELIKELSASILEEKGRLGSYGADIANLKKQIKENKEAQNEAESLRKKENEDYVATKAALEQGIANLGKAIKVLGDATASKGASHLSGSHPELGTVQYETRMLTVVAGVRSAMSLYSRRNSDDMNLRKADFASVKTFLSNPTAWVQTSVSSPHKAEYTTQSSAIQGMLKDMHDSFQRDLADAIETEKAKQEDYDGLMATKRQDLILLEDDLLKNEGGEGDDAKQLADNQKQREETQKQLDTDEAFLETTTKSCKDKANEWAERSRLRTEELAGINQAVDILTSDEAQASFSSASTTFVQVSKTSNAQQIRVANILKRTAVKSKNVHLALVATQVSAGMTWHFDKLIEDIDKMIAKLRAEEQDDIDKKDWCESERNAANKKNEKLEYEKDQLNKKMSRGSAKIDSLNNEHTDTEGQMSDLNTTMADALALRNKQNTDFKAAIKADSDSVVLLTKAIEALSKFYEKNSFVQSKQPEYTEDEDVAPEASFSGSTSRSSENTGIVSLLDMIKEDMENEMKVAREEEAKAEAEYRAMLKESQESMAAMEQKCVDLKSQVAAITKENKDTQAVHDDKHASKLATDKYLNDIKEECDWIDSKFDTRAAQRKDEIAGLESGKGQLAGMKAASLVTKKRAVGKRPSVDEEMKALEHTEQELRFGRDASFLQRRQ